MTGLAFHSENNECQTPIASLVFAASVRTLTVTSDSLVGCCVIEDPYDDKRRSVPVMSFGWRCPRTPRIVGAMSRSEPPDLKRKCSSPFTKIKGTGLVV